MSSKLIRWKTKQNQIQFQILDSTFYLELNLNYLSKWLIDTTLFSWQILPIWKANLLPKHFTKPLWSKRYSISSSSSFHLLFFSLKTHTIYNSVDCSLSPVSHSQLMLNYFRIYCILDLICRLKRMSFLYVDCECVKFVDFVNSNC